MFYSKKAAIEPPNRIRKINNDCKNFICLITMC